MLRQTELFAESELLPRAESSLEELLETYDLRDDGNGHHTLIRKRPSQFIHRDPLAFHLASELGF